MELKHPVTGKVMKPGPVPCRLRLAGPDSERYREMEREFEQALETAQGNADRPLAPDERYKIRRDKFLPCVLGWEGFFQDDGTTPLAFGRGELVRLFALKWPFEQAFAFASNRANFFGKGAETSSGDSATG